MCWGGRLFLKGGQEARLILFYKIINGLAQVPFKGVLVEAYKGTRRKTQHKIKVIQLPSMDSRFSLKTISAWNGACFR